jgi:4-hydroxy-3-polyprenylbenzoate decarboxylase
MEEQATGRKARRHAAAAPSAGRRDVGWRNLREWLDLVEKAGQLKRIAAPVDQDEELSAITFMATRNEAAPALLFENVATCQGTGRVLSNMLGASRERYALAAGLDPSLSTRAMIEATRGAMGRTLPPVEVPRTKAPVNEIVLTAGQFDLTEYPAPTFWPGDGGRYIGTGDIVFTRDPETGRINVGCYRQMLLGPNRIGLYCSPGKHGLLDREATWAAGRPLEVVAAYGVDPVLFMLAAQVFGHDESELDVAGGIMGHGISLCAAETVSLPVPAEAEFVVEGLVHPGPRAEEGPLGEFTGYYGRERSPQPVIEVTALHHRRDPIMTAALMARYPSCEIGAYYAIMRSARILDDLKRIGVGGVVGAYAHPAAASGWGLVVVALSQKHAGHAAQVLALTAQCPAAAYYTKWIIAVDDDVDPTDINDVLWALSTRCHPTEDIDLLRNTWSTGLDPSRFPADMRPYGAKVLINACKPHRYLAEFPQATLLRRSVYERVAGRWSELGFDQAPPKLTAFHAEQQPRK